MKKIWQAGLWLIAGLLAAGVLYLAAGKPRGVSITLTPPPPPAPISVHIIGAVQHPGVYHLPSASRVLDAVNAAGGFAADANQQSMNLAAFLQDGEQITIQSYSPTATAIPFPMAAGTQAISELHPQPTALAPNPDGLININTASAQELETLPGIGPVTATKIITYREANGGFKSIEEILEVPGIGPVKYAGIKDLITIQD